MEINQDEAVESPEADQLWMKLEMGRKIENMRACGICGKVFGSGKAIGGHMRIHARKSDREANDQKPRVDLKPVCELCGKVFPTMNSLFGHMRCHPERTWRGIRPPNSDRASSSPSVDLTDSLLRWSVTARRGRRAAAAEVSSSEDDEMREAVNNLMMLSRGHSSESGVKKIIKKRKKKKLCDLKVYRSFQTHQALGGHCASHNKFKSDDDRETNDEAARSSDTSQKVMDIDLNEAPAPEDEAGFGTD